jgi:exodeoxyribonuclease-3
VRLITWNLARRRQTLPGQAGALASREPDVVALQEVTAGTLPLWRQALERIGLPHVACTLDTAPWQREPRSRRTTGVIVAAATPVETLDDRPVDPPWPETVLTADVAGVRIHAAHVPNAANGWTKVRTLEALAQLAGRDVDGGRPVVVAGDLNTPRRETPDGIITFARDTKGRLRRERGAEWDEAELALLDGRTGLVDAFRALHPDARDVSWAWSHGGGWRLDHILVGGPVAPQAALYHHDWRAGGLSDHAAMEADLLVES